MSHDEQDAIDFERLDQYVRGAGAPGDRAVLEAWVTADPKRWALAEAMRSIGWSGGRHTTQLDTRRALARMRRQLGFARAAAPRHRVDKDAAASLFFRSSHPYAGDVALEISIAEANNPLVKANGSSSRLDKAP